MRMDEICKQKPGPSSGYVVRLGIRVGGRQLWHAGLMSIQSNLCTRGTCTVSVRRQLAVTIGEGTKRGSIEVNSLEGVEFTCSSGVGLGLITWSARAVIVKFANREI